MAWVLPLSTASWTSDRIISWDGGLSNSLRNPFHVEERLVDLPEFAMRVSGKQVWVARGDASLKLGSQHPTPSTTACWQRCRCHAHDCEVSALLKQILLVRFHWN